MAWCAEARRQDVLSHSGAVTAPHAGQALLFTSHAVAGVATRQQPRAAARRRLDTQLVGAHVLQRRGRRRRHAVALQTGLAEAALVGAWSAGAAGVGAGALALDFDHGGALGVVAGDVQPRQASVHAAAHFVNDQFLQGDAGCQGKCKHAHR